MCEQDRRRFQRFSLTADCELMLDEEHRGQPARLLDLSINGALIELAAPAGFAAISHGGLSLRVSGLKSASIMQMYFRVRVLRVDERKVACRFERVDIDSFANLKDLIALRLGEPSLLDRELTRLDYWPGVSRAAGDS